MNRVEIVFCDKNIPNDLGFVLELSYHTKYDQMIEAVAERVGIDKHRIQIFKCQRYISCGVIFVVFFFRKTYRLICEFISVVP